MLEPAQIQMQEAVYSLRHYQQRLELDPTAPARSGGETRRRAQRSAQVQVQIADIPEHLQRIKARLAELAAGFDPDALHKREADALETYRKRPPSSPPSRKKAATDLAKKVTASMQTLAMAGGSFEVALVALARGSAHGLEQIEFLVSRPRRHDAADRSRKWRRAANSRA